MAVSEHAARYFDAVADLARAVDTRPGRRDARGAWRRCGSAAGACSSSASAGGAGHASHAVNDFRKLCRIETYAPTDNVSELTARTNDDGWDTSFTAWLEISKLSADDGLLVFSVGGGSREHNVSVNVVNAIELARERGALIYGVVGAPGGTLAELADVAVVVDAPAISHAAGRVLPGGRLARARVPPGAGRPAGSLGVAGGRRSAVSGRRAPSSSTATGSSTSWSPIRSAAGPNRRCASPTSRLIAGAAAALRRLAEAAGGWSGVSNQPGAAKGMVSLDELHADPGAGARSCSPPKGVRFDDFRLCLHHPDGRRCRS